MVYQEYSQERFRVCFQECFRECFRECLRECLRVCLRKCLGVRFRQPCDSIEQVCVPPIRSSQAVVSNHYQYHLGTMWFPETSSLVRVLITMSRRLRRRRERLERKHLAILRKGKCTQSLEKRRGRRRNDGAALVASICLNASGSTIIQATAADPLNPFLLSILRQKSKVHSFELRARDYMSRVGAFNRA